MVKNIKKQLTLRMKKICSVSVTGLLMGAVDLSTLMYNIAVIKQMMKQWSRCSFHYLPLFVRLEP